MLKRTPLFMIAGLMLLCLDSDGQKPKNYRDEALLLKKAILANHFSPRKIDNSFSNLVFDNFVDELDPDRLFFTAEEVKVLSAYRWKLDDELNGTGWAFLPAVTGLYKRSLARAEHLSETILQTPFSFVSKDVLPDDTLWAANEPELNKRWQLAAKYEVLSKLQEMRSSSSEKDDKKFLQGAEPQARLQAKTSISRSIKRISNHPSGFEDHIATLYLEALAKTFDPHTSYYSSSAMENFVSSLSSEGYYFGLVLDENEKGEIVIQDLTPGGPAWKSGALNAGDVIRQVKWEGKDPLDVSGVTIDEMNDLLLESNHGSLEITVAKPGGLPETVRLKKEKMESKENIVKSFILNGKRKIGFVSLPGFYTNWGEQEGSQCANDVAKEIIKLKKENIEGLIIDLRFNGGGSMQEAVAMAGIFVDAGPIGVIRDKTGESTTIKDMNRGTIYDAPLVVMVNSLSASASEFFAAALQDYNRAIIVGSRTYGKATAQSVFPLDGKDLNSARTKPDPGVGFAKITLEKIYRITGKTAQFKGVVPHIIFPDVYDSLNFGEDTMPLALPSDSIFKKIYYQPLPLLPIAELNYKSTQRTKENNGFALIKSVSGILKEVQRDQKQVSLVWSDFSKKATDRNSRLKKFEAAPRTTAFSVGHHSFEMQRMQMDQYVEDFNKAWIKKLEKDISLEEAFLIICDYIDITLRKPK